MKEAADEVKGTVFNIQRFSLHDGPGIRTTIFLKGCPLRCIWCQNPEGIDSAPQLLRHARRCLGCGTCITVCTAKAITVDSVKGPVIDRRACRSCFECAAACPGEALEKAGRLVTVTEVLTEVLKDRAVYEQSGGGVTISGGEPLIQPNFLTALLEALKNEGLHTAVDTCGSADPHILEKAASWTDLFLFDIKYIGDAESIKYTGAQSSLILNNLSNLVRNDHAVLVRVPLIPGVNDDDANIDAIGRFLNKLGLTELELVPYHNYGASKYDKLDLDYQGAAIGIPLPEQINEKKAILESHGLNIISEVDSYD